MISYIVNSVLCSGLLWIVYRLFLANENMYVFNRCYLLLSIVFSLTVPLVTIHLPQQVETPVAEQRLNIQNAPDLATPTAPAIIVPANIKSDIPKQADLKIASPQNFNWQQGLVIFYVLGCTVLLLRFIRNLYLVRRVISRNSSVAVDNSKLILVDGEVAPHSFLKYIFVSKTDYVAGNIQPEIICHEQTHTRQLHSVDVVFIELVQIICWFNPFMPLYRRSIQLNHEFLADEAVINNYEDTPAYQYLLLDKMVQSNRLAFTSEFVSYLTIKRRLLMMAKNTTKAEAWVVKIAIIPVLATAFILFCNKATAIPVITDTKAKPVAIHFPKITYTAKQIAAMDDRHKAEVAYQQTYEATTKRVLAEQIWNKEISVKVVGRCEDESGTLVGTIANYGDKKVLIEANNGNERDLNDALKTGEEVKVKVLGASYFYRKDRPLEVTPEYVVNGRDTVFNKKNIKPKANVKIVLTYDRERAKNNPTVVTWWHIKTKVIPPSATDAPQAVLDEYRALLEKYHLPPVPKNGIVSLQAEIYTPDHLKLQGLYDSMSKRQQDSQPVKFSNLIMPTEKHIPTAKLLQDWQDISTYRVWINDKKIDQAELANYKPSDFDLYYLYALSKTTNPNYKDYHYEVKLMTPAYYADYYKKTSERKIRSLQYPGLF